MPQAHRPTIIVGNWKMHKTIAEAKAFIKGLSPQVGNCSANVWLAVPFTAIQASAEEAHGTSIAIGAQNAHDQDEGPFTGEISCRMIKEAGATFVLLGHSERRHGFQESSAWVNKKVLRALQDGLRPIVCIGETLSQHQAGVAHEILDVQLTQSLNNLSDQDLKKVIIAYEPVWAIGTNQTATPQHAQEIHHFCRELIARHWNVAAADKMPILYGGSVKPDNAAALLDQPDIDGLLVGGCSLSLDSFTQIIHCQTSKSLNL